MRRTRYPVFAIVIALVAVAVIYVGLHPTLYLGTIAEWQSAKFVKHQPIIADKQRDIHARYNGNLAVKSFTQIERLARRKEKVVLRGFIRIPAISVKLPIYEGASDKVLALGAGTLKPNQHMGAANYAVGAHNMADNRTYFSPLQAKLKRGMYVTLTNKHMQYRYIITKKEVISQNAVRVINDRPTGGAIITLITCYEEPPYFTGATKRVYAVGRLVKTIRLN